MEKVFYYKLTEEQLRDLLLKEAILTALSAVIDSKSELFVNAILDFCKVHEVQNIGEFVDDIFRENLKRVGRD